MVVLTPSWDDVFGYLELAGSFPDDVRVLALTYHELPGDWPVTTVDELVTESLSLIVEQLPEGGPTAIVGWSIGGVVAAEVSERLRSSGHEVNVVALIDTFFPGRSVISGRTAGGSTSRSCAPARSPRPTAKRR